MKKGITEHNIKTLAFEHFNWIGKEQELNKRGSIHWWALEICK